MAEGEWHAFRPIKHPMGFEYVPAAPQPPTPFEQREMTYRNVAKLFKAMGDRAVNTPPDDSENYHRGLLPDEDEFYIRFRDEI